MQLTVIDEIPLATDVVRIGLAAPGGSKLPAFKPGAHLELSFAGHVRRYSLTSSPRDLCHYVISVLRTRPSRGGSAYLHDLLRVGDSLHVAGPFSAFPLNLDARHSVFIAGGIGITPFLSMMEALAQSSRSFELHYAARSTDRFLPVPADAELYVCGPRDLIEAVRAGTAARGWPGKRVHLESFGAGFKPADRPVTVHLALSGNSIEVPPETTILDALLAGGVWAPYECRRGECASCMTEVLAGKPDHRDLCLTEEQRRHAMCPCVSRARTLELVLNL